MITVSHLWRDEGLTPPLTGLYLAVPGVCVISDLPEKYREKEKAFEQNKDAPVFDRGTSNFLSSENASVLKSDVRKLMSLRSCEPEARRSSPLTLSLPNRA